MIVIFHQFLVFGLYGTMTSTHIVGYTYGYPGNQYGQLNFLRLAPLLPKLAKQRLGISIIFSQDQRRDAPTVRADHDSSARRFLPSYNFLTSIN